MRAAVTLGFDQTRIADVRNGQTRMIGGRIEVDHGASDVVRLHAGADFELQAYGSTALKWDDPENPNVQARNALFPKRTDVATGAYGDLVIQAGRNVEVTPGVRVDLYGSGDVIEVGVDPRLAARFRVSDCVKIVHAYGIAHQPPSFIAPIPGLVPGTLDKGLQTSLQTSAGVEIQLDEHTTASATAFDNVFLNMSDAGSVAPDYDPTNTDFQINEDVRSLGSSVGIELMVRRPLTQRLGGFASYTLSRSMRSLERESFSSAFDRTHVANGALAYNLGRNWRAGTRLLFYTGTPKRHTTNGQLPA